MIDGAARWLALVHLGSSPLDAQQHRADSAARAPSAARTQPDAARDERGQRAARAEAVARQHKPMRLELMLVQRRRSVDSGGAHTRVVSRGRSGAREALSSRLGAARTRAVSAEGVAAAADVPDTVEGQRVESIHSSAYAPPAVDMMPAVMPERPSVSRVDSHLGMSTFCHHEHA